MTAAEAKKKAIWNSIPISIRLNIQEAVKYGVLHTYLNKNVTPEAFNHIDTTIAKLQLLGYKAECNTVDRACGITTDTVLIIMW